MKYFAIAVLIASATDNFARGATATKRQARLRAAPQVNCNCIGATKGGPSYASEAAAEGNEVRRLSDEMEKASSELGVWRNKIAKAKAHYNDQEKLLREQIKIRKEMAKATAGSKDEAYYTTRICGKLVRSKLLGDDAAKIEVNEICIGRTQLALSAFKVLDNSSTLDASASAVECGCARNTSLLARSRRDLHRDVAAEGDPQKLKDMVEKLKRQVVTTEKQYHSDLETQRAALAKLDKEEDELGKASASHHADRKEEQSKAWISARDRACAAINAGADVSAVCG